MSDYMLLLYENPSDFAAVSPEEMQAIIGKYSAWRDGLAESGRLIASDKLRDGEGRYGGLGSRAHISQCMGGAHSQPRVFALQRFDEDRHCR